LRTCSPYGELKGPHGLQVRNIGDKVMIDGELSTLEEVLRVDAIRALYPNVKVLAKASAALVQAQRRAAELDLARLGVSGVQVQTIERRLLIDGHVADPVDAAAVEGVYQARLEPLEPFL
jgi:hypothetical protein